MKTINKGSYTEVVADEGKFLSQTALDDESERIFVLAACTIHPEQWEEWTVEQKDIWESNHSEPNDLDPIDMEDM